jgi:tRNA(Ile)-lysidine synthase
VFADDETNDDTSILRNHIRLDVIPAMRHAHPNALDHLLAMAEESRDAVSALEAIAATALLPSRDGHVHLDRATVRSLPDAVAPYAYRLAVTRLLGDARELDRRHYARLARAAYERTGAQIELPRRIVVTVDPAELIVSVGPLTLPEVDGVHVQPLPYTGRLGAWDISITVPEAELHRPSSIIHLPSTAVLRARRPGDRIPGLHKKLQDAYTDAKIPRRERDAAPVIAAGGDVFWTPLLAVPETSEGERYRVEAARVS